MAKLGMMEGRLVPPEAGKFQSFPRERWRDEFGLAVQVPLSYIEWIYDGYGEDVNPLVHDVSRLRSLIDASGVEVRSICADFFMEYPFVRCGENQRSERQKLLVELLANAKKIGAGRVVLPLVDNSEIFTSGEMDIVVTILKQTVIAARALGVELHLETSLNPHAFGSFLDRLIDPMIKVNYDTGNSSALGYRPRDELEVYGARIGSVHIKDRKLGDGSVPLGAGDTDFAEFFSILKDLKYVGDFTLQVTRSQAGEELAWARVNRAFVARYWRLD